jgi:hypothetical protein
MNNLRGPVRASPASCRVSNWHLHTLVCETLEAQASRFFFLSASLATEQSITELFRSRVLLCTFNPLARYVVWAWVNDIGSEGSNYCNSRRKNGLSMLSPVSIWDRRFGDAWMAFVLAVVAETVCCTLDGLYVYRAIEYTKSFTSRCDTRSMRQTHFLTSNFA